MISALRAALDKRGRFESEAAQKLDQFRYTLTLALPHEFRTPLDVIFGYAEVLTDEARERHDDELDAVALGIRNAARQLNRITENFMLWTQLASLRPNGDMRELLGSSEPVALDLVVGTGTRERAAQVGRSADLVCDLEPAPAYVRRDFLRKIAVELVDNAFKFSPAGSMVRVSTGCRGGRTTLTVTDRGPGMPDEAAEPPDENYVPSEQGVGLGLAIVRRVVGLAGGQVNVHHPANGGTTVVVSLPSTRVLERRATALRAGAAPLTWRERTHQALLHDAHRQRTVAPEEVSHAEPPGALRRRDSPARRAATRRRERGDGTTWRGRGSPSCSAIVPGDRVGQRGGVEQRQVGRVGDDALMKEQRLGRQRAARADPGELRAAGAAPA